MKLKIGIIGGGNMGSAILSSIFQKYEVFVCEKDKKRAAFLRRKYNVLSFSLFSLVRMSDVIILAVKPQDSNTVWPGLKKEMTKEKTLISIAAGLTSSFIEKKIGGKPRVVRTMPNMPAQIKEGITGIALGKYAKRSDAIIACNIFDNVGKTVVVEEKWIDAITAVSGSGPAYVFYFIENLMNAAKALGLNEKLSKDLVKETVSGSVHLFMKYKDVPETLRSRVTSKGGTTEAAIKVLQKKKMDKIYLQALRAAQKRAKQLAKK